MITFPITMDNLPDPILDNIRQNFYQCLIELSTEEGINASGKDEIYGCIFGRDSAITILKILKLHQAKPSFELLDICKRALLTLIRLQGKEFNIESGEEPGKFIHEFRKEKSQYHHLTLGPKPFYVYPDEIMRLYDSIDSTPLILIALYKYWEITRDKKFLITILPAVEAGLNWIITFGDKDKDLFIEYEFPPDRKHGGLVVQSWTDSHQSLIQQDGKIPKYPIAPVEAQAFAWLALRVWADYYSFQHPVFSKKLLQQAKKIKKRFNQKFLLEDKNLIFAAQALDGNKNQIKTITANPLLVLWSSYQKQGKHESILEDKYINDFVKRGFISDLFIEDAGIRTMSSESPFFNPNQDSYHNGSFWPMLNGLIAEGLINFGYFKEAQQLKLASLIPIKYFNCPIELYVKKDGGFLEFCSSSGQVSCKKQAWSAAAILDLLAV